MATAKAIIDANLNGHGHAVYEAAKNAGFEIALNEEGRLDLADACALVDHESAGGQNIFGCDFGSQWTFEPPYCNVEVTAERVQALLSNIEAGGGQNGVGLTQLTSVNLVREAERRGGAHLPEHQCSVGFEYLKSLVDDLGYMYGIAAYNAGPGNASLGISNGYYSKIQARREKWKELLAGSVEGAEPATQPAVDTGGSAQTSGILTAKEGTNFRKGLDYILPIIGLRDYWVWSSGEVPAGEGMYAANEELPPWNRSAASIAPG
jgi:Transglycosylase SLT domain